MKAFNKKINNQKGFTLLEMLSVIAIIGILAAVVIVALNPGRQFAQARNSQRQSDLTAVHTAMNLYFVKELEWPATIPNSLTEICDTGDIEGDPDAEDDDYSGEDCDGDDLIDLSLLVPDYLAEIPVDPQGPEISLLNQVLAASGGTGYYVALDNPTEAVIASIRSTEYDLPLVAIGTSTSPLDTPEINNALSVDGTGDYAQVPDSPDFTLGASFSISVWVKTSDTVGEIIANFEEANPYKGFSLAIGADTSGIPAIYMSNVAGTGFLSDTSGGTVNDNQWHHIVVTYDGSNVRFYRDGTAEQVTAVVNSVGNSSNVLRIGLDTNTSPSRPLNGRIDELVIYNTVLTGGDVTSLYNGGEGDYTSDSGSTVAIWHFDEEGSSDASDSSGNSHHGVLNGDATYASGHIDQ